MRTGSDCRRSCSISLATRKTQSKAVTSVISYLLERLQHTRKTVATQAWKAVETTEPPHTAGGSESAAHSPSVSPLLKYKATM